MSETPGAAAEGARRLLVQPPASPASARGLVRRVADAVSRRVLAPLYAAVRELARGIDLAAAAGAASVEAVDARASDLQAQVDGLAERLRLAELRLVGGEQDTDALRQRVIAIEGTQPSVQRASSPPPVPSEEALLDELGYVAFEQRFRGAPEDIRARQQDAVRYVAHLQGADLRLLDLGCGRGEWLQVVREAGIACLGVDSNADMVAQAREEGLDVHQADALDYLAHLPAGSLGAITGFHIAEHLPLPVLGELLRLALRALAPGAVLVLETPNPQNLQVGASSFYLDPTHLRPLHPLFLQFLAEDRGFVDTELHFVHSVDDELLTGSAEDDERPRVLAELARLAFGPQDFVLVARRPEELAAG